MKADRLDPVTVFRFALRERDWRLAWLVAKAVSGERAMLGRLTRELRVLEAGRPSPESLTTLGALDAVLEPLARAAERD